MPLALKLASAVKHLFWELRLMAGIDDAKLHALVKEKFHQLDLAELRADHGKELTDQRIELLTITSSRLI